jgi:outer membrane protein assembly factor BamE (lipoprotein component of BamABCDE complex)
LNTHLQQAIVESRVERGMTREQVIMALGYPPTHRTASTSAKEWTYWSGHFDTYVIVFDDAGRVSQIGTGRLPTSDQPINQ